MSAPDGGRRRNATDSRARLLQAAVELFGERGYERATVRELGARAGVDPALIARYFGSKAELYLEALAVTHDPSQRPSQQPQQPPRPLDPTDAEAMQGLLDRVSAGRPTPAMHAAVEPHADAQLQGAALALLHSRIVDPAQQIAGSWSAEDAPLRAQLATAALAGVVLSRSSGALAALAEAPSAEVGRLLAVMLDALLSPPPGGPHGDV